MVFAGDAGIGRLCQPPGRGRGQRDRVGGLVRVEPQQARRRARRGENRGIRAVEAAFAKPGHRVDDAPGSLVTDDDCRQHVFAATAVVLGRGERGRDQRRSAMHDCAQVAVVGCGGVAHHCVDLRGRDDRQFGAAIEPDRGARAAAEAACHVFDDPGGLQPAAHRRAGDRAGDQHCRMVKRLRRQFGSGDPHHKVR